MRSTLIQDQLSAKLSSSWFMFANFLVFQCIWGLSVFGQEKWVSLSLLLLALHFFLSQIKKKDFWTVLFVGISGVFIDSTLTFFNVFVFADNALIPFWLVILWAAFALTLNHSLVWLTKLHPSLQSFLGGVGGTFSYWMGYNLGAVEFSFSAGFSCAILFIIWCLIMPLFCLFVSKNTTNA